MLRHLLCGACSSGSPAWESSRYIHKNSVSSGPLKFINYKGLLVLGVPCFGFGNDGALRPLLVPAQSCGHICAAVCGRVARRVRVGSFFPASIPRRRVPVRAVARAVAPPSESSRLMARLPQNDTGLPELLHKQADAINVSLDEVSYSRERERGLAVWQQRASFSLDDSYGQIRHFLGGALRAQSNIALEALDCTRDDIASAELNCNIRVVAFARADAMPTERSHGR